MTINIPDCATASNDSNDVINITTEHCPVQPPGPAPVIGTFSVVIIGIVLAVFFVATAIVRYRAHELKPERLKAKNEAKQIELDAEVKMAALRKTCSTCGADYTPTLETK